MAFNCVLLNICCDSQIYDKQTHKNTDTCIITGADKTIRSHMKNERERQRNGLLVPEAAEGKLLHQYSTAAVCDCVSL